MPTRFLRLVVLALLVGMAHCAASGTPYDFSGYSWGAGTVLRLLWMLVMPSSGQSWTMAEWRSSGPQKQQMVKGTQRASIGRPLKPGSTLLSDT